MDEWIDRSLGAMGFATTTMFGKNKQVTEVLHYVDGDGQTLDGSFILTIGKKAVILTRDRKPFIVKRWSPAPVGITRELSNRSSLVFSGGKVIAVFQDTDGWIWEWVSFGEEDCVRVRVGGEMLFEVEF